LKGGLAEVIGILLEKMLQTIKEQLKKQEEDRKFSEKKVVEFIETRIKELETIDERAVQKRA
jgi:hypothetical protein